MGRRPSWQHHRHPRAAGTSASTSHGLHDPIRNCFLFSAPGRPTRPSDNGRLSGTTQAPATDHAGGGPAARRDSGTLSGTSAEEEQMTGKIMPLRERDISTIQAAADAFLSSPRYANPNTRRGYTG